MVRPLPHGSGVWSGLTLASSVQALGFTAASDIATVIYVDTWMMRKALVAAMRLEGRLEDTLKNKREEGRCGV